MTRTATASAPRLIVPLLALACASCFPHDYGPCPYNVEGSPDQYTLAAGKQPGGFFVTAPQLCADGRGTVVVSSAGASVLDDLWVERVSKEVRSSLGLAGIYVWLPYLSAPGCDPESAEAKQLQTFAIDSWARVEATVQIIGDALVLYDLSGSMAVDVGIPGHCD